MLSRKEQEKQDMQVSSPVFRTLTAVDVSSVTTAVPPSTELISL